MTWIDRLKDRLFGPKMLDISDIPRRQDIVSDVQAESAAKGEKTPEKEVESRCEVEPVKACERAQNAEKAGEFPGRVLFVCSGNMCRSPYGEVRFKSMLDGRKVQVISAGTLRLTGRGAATEMIAAARERGLNLENHRSSALTPVIIKASDAIFVMEKMHRMEVLRLCPDASEKVVMLGTWLNEPQEELEDPMGKAPEVYRRVADQIDEALRNWFSQF